jgi:hypothetical protein
MGAAAGATAALLAGPASGLPTASASSLPEATRRRWAGRGGSLESEHGRAGG